MTGHEAKLAECFQCGGRGSTPRGICLRCEWDHKERNMLIIRPLILPEWHPLELGYHYKSVNWLVAEGMKEEWGNVWAHTEHVQFAVMRKKFTFGYNR